MFNYIFLNPNFTVENEHCAAREEKLPMNITRACGIVDIASVYETEDREFDPRLAHFFARVDTASMNNNKYNLKIH